jgi:hypothetical protein
MNDNPMSRMKFLWEDGRKVYPSKRGKITITTTQHALKLAGKITNVAYTFRDSSIIKASA